MYGIRLVDGRFWTRHVDHIRRRTIAQSRALDNRPPLVSPTPSITPITKEPNPNIQCSSGSQPKTSDNEPVADTGLKQAAHSPRRSTRQNAGIPPLRFGIDS